MTGKTKTILRWESGDHTVRNGDTYGIRTALMDLDRGEILRTIKGTSPKCLDVSMLHTSPNGQGTWTSVAYPTGRDTLHTMIARKTLSILGMAVEMESETEGGTSLTARIGMTVTEEGGMTTVEASLRITITGQATDKETGLTEPATVASISASMRSRTYNQPKTVDNQETTING